MRLLKRVYFSKLVRGSFLLFIAGNFASFGNFLYNLAMGRMLSPAVYGELEAIVSLSVLFAVPMSVLSIFIVKIVSSSWGQKKREEIQSFLTVYRRNLFIISLIGGVFLLFFNPIIIKFLNLSSVLSIIFLILFLLLNGVSTINNSGLQGTLSFGYLTINSLIGSGIKLIISVLLVFLNFQLFGALFGPFLGLLLTFILSVWELKNIFKGVASTDKKIPPAVVKTTFFPTLFASLALTSFLTMDVILARHFFTQTGSGQYAVIAVLGKVVFYAVGPVISVMFPLISSRASSGEPYLLPLLGSLVMSLGTGSVIVFTFFMFPEFILKTLFAGKYPETVPYLGSYAFFMILYSLNAILTYFLLSISYYRPMWLLFCLSLLQGILIILFHSSIGQLIWINVSVSLLYFMVVSGLVCQRINFLSLFRRTVK